MSETARLAGRVLCLGFPGTDPAAALEYLRPVGPGAVVLFARNVTTVDATRALVDDVRRGLGDDVLFAVDQEGGSVARLRDGATRIPSMMALGATCDGALAERVGAALAADVRRAGGDVDFAPVLDLALAPASTVVGTRSLGDDPALVAELGAALVRGLQGGGVAATPKHFPGHGASAADSHLGPASLAADVHTLHTRELVPFRAALAAGARALMLAHLRVPALDASRPASRSTAVATSLLREELGFTGACFTDCLDMRGAGDDDLCAAAVDALAAGVDFLVISHSFERAPEVVAGIERAVERGALPLEQLRHAVARGNDLRAWSRRQTPRATEDTSDVGRVVAARAVTVVRGDPVLRADVPVAVVSFEGAAHDGIGSVREDGSLSLALRRRRRRSELLRVPLEPDAAMSEHLRSLLALQPERELVLVVRGAARRPAQRQAVDVLLAAFPHALVVVAAEPFDVAYLARAPRVVCSYDDGEPMLEALADVLTGKQRAPGRLPVDVRAAVG